MAQQFDVMAAAMVIAVGVMLVFAGRVGDFVNRHPSMKILALGFLLPIGVMRTAEGLGQDVGKGYISFAMAFSFLIETLNRRLWKKQRPVHLHGVAEKTPSAGP
jgi:predicted tellurium resistance membrane protein TerC